MRPAAAAAVALAGAQLGPAVTGIPALTRRLPPRAGAAGSAPAGFGVALTFDDGPHPDGTPRILDVLAGAGVTAVFFVVGEQLARRPDLGRRIAAEGHELAVHGWDHRPLPLAAPWRAGPDLARTVELITDLGGRRPRRYRPPYGVASGSALLAARRLGLAPTWWTGWGRDWSRRATPESILSTLDGHYRAGRNVLLLHDSDAYGRPGSWRATAAAVDRLVLRWRSVLLRPDQW